MRRSFDVGHAKGTYLSGSTTKTKRKRTSHEICPKRDNTRNRDNPHKEGAEKIMSPNSDLGGRVCFALSRLASSGPKSFSLGFSNPSLSLLNCFGFLSPRSSSCRAPDSTFILTSHLTPLYIFDAHGPISRSSMEKNNWPLGLPVETVNCIPLAGDRRACPWTDSVTDRVHKGA
jgi:hypothetical protein